MHSKSNLLDVASIERTQPAHEGPMSTVFFDVGTILDEGQWSGLPEAARRGAGGGGKGADDSSLDGIANQSSA